MQQTNTTYESPQFIVKRRFSFGEGNRANIILRRTFSNIFVTLTDLNYKVIICRTSGNSGVEGQKRKKRSALALEKIVKALYEHIVLHNIEVVRIISRMKLNRYYYCLKKELHIMAYKLVNCALDALLHYVMREAENYDVGNMWGVLPSYLNKEALLQFTKQIPKSDYSKQFIVNRPSSLRIKWLHNYFIKHRMTKSSNILKNQFVGATKVFNKAFIKKKHYKGDTFVWRIKLSTKSLLKTQKDKVAKKFEISTIRNTSFDFSIINAFTKILFFADLPFFFDKGLHDVLRYASSFYGITYKGNSYKDGLWLTFGLKKNIAVPFGLFYKTNKPRSNYFSSINKKSWHRYVFLVKNSFIKNHQVSLDYNDTLYINNINNYFFFLTDSCHFIRRAKFKYHRAISLINDIDFSISTYHTKFEYFDLRQRAIFCWISNNNLLRDSAFFIRSIDISIILYPSRFFKYKAFSEALIKFHRSWFFLDKISTLNKDVNIQINLFNILLELSIKQVWGNFNFFFKSNDQFLNFRLLLFKIIKNVKYSKYLLLFNKLALNEIALYAFFFNCDFKFYFKKRYKRSQLKVKWFQYWFIKKFTWLFKSVNKREKVTNFFVKICQAHDFKFNKIFKNVAKYFQVLNQTFNMRSLLNYKYYFFNRFKFINRYYMFQA